MQTLIEQYNEIQQKISSLNRQIEDYSAQIEGLTAQRDEEIPERIENLKKQLEKIDEYQLKIDGFIQMAEKHMTSKNLPTIEAPEGYRVNLNRLRSWSMLIDPMVEDDVYAQKVYLVANCDKQFLAQKKEEFAARIVQLENDFNVGAPSQIRELTRKIDAVKEQIRVFLESDEVSRFSDSVRRGNEEKMYLETPVAFTDHEKDPEYLVPGAYGTEIRIIENQREQLKSSLGRFYDEHNSRVYLPVERILSSDEFAMTVSCVPARKKINEMDSGIRNLLFQIIDRSPAGSRKIYIIDAVRENSALLGGLKGLEGTAVVEPVPRNDEQILQTLESIVSGFSDIDDVLENHDTVMEYNQEAPAEKRIQRSVVVLVGWPNEMDGDNKEYARKIFSNYERYGISFIAVRISANRKNEEDDLGFSDYVGENIVSVSMTMRETTIRFGQEPPMSFAWYPFKYTLGSDYCNAIKKISTGKGQRVTDYAQRGLLDGGITYERGRKLLDLPYGVDGKDRLHRIVFENENFASFLMGASGSGKSTLLHALITGIIKNYHPDDVELWLADFKMSEFAQYIDPMPPHVKYILLDESQELIFDLIDKLTEKMMERQRFFMKNRELKKVEKVPTDTYMPVIFVILDEFSIMSQAINDSQQYRLKLQNLLAKGRALGIKFLFSSQTFTTGVTGLTPTAKAQIQMRIAMKAAKTEIVETLELSSSQKTDQVQNWIDALPVYHALIKYRDKSDGEDRVLVRRTTVLYFDDKDSPGDPYKKQRDLILEAKSRMRKMEGYDPSVLDAYVDKHPVVVDGNSYDAYDEALVSARCEEIKKTDSLAGDELLVAFGRPRLMSDVRITPVTQESRENFLLFAPAAEQMCAASVLVSMIKQFRRQEQEIEIWTYSRSRIYRTYAHVFDALGCAVVKDVADISESIKQLKQKIQDKISGNKLVILLGMERICGDFGYEEGNSEFVWEFHLVPTKEFSEREWKMTQFADNWAEYSEKIQKEHRGSEEELNRLLDEAQQKLVDMINDAWEKSMREKEQAEQGEAPEAEASGQEASEAEATQQETETKPGSEKEAEPEYNALEDFKDIVKRGSRYGYHFALYLCNYADLKATAFSADWFRHRLSFQMSVDDSRELFNSKVASQLPEHVCQYYDLLEGYSFRPYLHQGIEWDGWGVSEAGELISPYLS